MDSIRAQNLGNLIAGLNYEISTRCWRKSPPPGLEEILDLQNYSPSELLYLFRTIRAYLSFPYVKGIGLRMEDKGFLQTDRRMQEEILRIYLDVTLFNVRATENQKVSFLCRLKWEMVKPGRFVKPKTVESKVW